MSDSPSARDQGLVGVIDYAAGNTASVVRALDHLKVTSRRVSSAEGLGGCDVVVLPGVGSAGATMRSLNELALVGPLTEFVEAGGRFIGICVGLQILFEHSEEEDATCLGWLPGNVVRLEGVRVPQIGWNYVRSLPGSDDLAPDLNAHFYFVNSYVAVPDDDDVVAAVADYGGLFPAVVERGNITATQFHLEKSGERGLRLFSTMLAKRASVPC